MKEMKTVERDISWMHFNHRILEEAERETVPVLERLSFLGIYSNNLDEFFRVRVASMKRMALCKEKAAKAEAEQAARILKHINRLNEQYAKQYKHAVETVTDALRQENINIVSDKALTEAQREFVHDFFRRRLFGRVSPIWAADIKHFAGEADDTIYLVVRLTAGSHKPRHAIVPLPVSHVGRWVELPSEGDTHYIMYLDDVVRACLPLIFPGIEAEGYEAYSFKFTRDAEMEIDNDLTKGFMQKISKGVRSRKAGTPLRLVYDGDMPDGLLRRVRQCLASDGKLDATIAGGRYQNHRDLMRFPTCGRQDLKYPRQEPLRPVWLDAKESIFDVIRAQDRYLHVPYHSFDGYIRLLNEAAINPHVKSIKTTLYRLAHDSKVITALVNAAQNGKKVTVVIELLARFDEASNISWSKKMQDAGINVVFGVEGLKVHSKITHIAFSSGTSVACISTGNFHEGNASAYTDVLMFTARRNITSEVERVFRFITRPYSPVGFKELLVSPNAMKRQFVQMIDREVTNHLAGRPAYIRCKVNHVTEPQIVEHLYAAAMAGVPVDLLVRGNCALTDSPALGGNLRVVGIIDRYLEHARIFRFCNGGDERVFIGSADWMPRNLDCRVEVVAPVYDEALKAECRRIVDYGLADTRQGRVVVGSADTSRGDTFRSQEELYKHYETEQKQLIF